MHESLLGWIVLLPLLGAAVNGLLGVRLPRPLVSAIGVGTVAASFVMSVMTFFAVKENGIVSSHLWTWIPIGDLSIELTFMADPLSAAMLLLVTGVGLLIHVYSTGYMHGDPSYHRFFSYLNLFVFSMLVLVSGDNLLLLFVGWEGVGLCSYLLIGFWFSEEANAKAGKKAFVVNRVGDFGFLIGMFLIVKTLAGQVEPGANLLAFDVIRQHIDLLVPVATAVGLLLFVGATGKSAQIPLYVWLPDAMAGPTPVSALIHAATMVTAGVYMVARLGFLYDVAPVAGTVIAVVGAATALLAASIALAQNDIKKVLAYSTVSQLGYMFLACGVGAYYIGMFHVFTHAFFKALLFLGAGSVIHSMHEEQDMRNMGGLRKYMPITFGTMAIATLAIAGVPPFSGFFSKDEILYYAFKQSPVLWGVGFVVAGMTAFYMARLMMMTFFGQPRMDEKTKSHLHESPLSMTVPLMILAVLSFAGGWMNIPEFIPGGDAKLHHWLEPSTSGDIFLADHGHGDAHGAELASDAEHGGEHGAEVAAHSTSTEWTLAISSAILALLGLGAGYVVYGKRVQIRSVAESAPSSGLRKVLENKWYVDEFYDATIIQPIRRLSDTVLWRFVDAVIIDGVLVNGVSRLIGVTGQLVRLVQNGLIRWYAYSFAAGVVVLLVYVARRING